MRTRISVLGALLAVGLCTLVVRADLTATVTLSNSYGSTGGGEFLATPTNFGFEPLSLGQDPGQFEVFCVEYNEYINFGVEYYVEINDEAVNGGVGGPSPDPLDPKTAFLYNEFITGQLSSAGYNYGTESARVESANALQAVIWLFEEEITTLSDVLSPAEVTLAGDFIDHADANVGTTWNGIGNVRILNMYEHANRTGFAQDQLVAIPAPSGLLLGVIGLGLVRKAGR